MQQNTASITQSETRWGGHLLSITGTTSYTTIIENRKDLQFYAVGGKNAEAQSHIAKCSILGMHEINDLVWIKAFTMIQAQWPSVIFPGAVKNVCLFLTYGRMTVFFWRLNYLKHGNNALRWLVFIFYVTFSRDSIVLVLHYLGWNVSKISFLVMVTCPLWLNMLTCLITSWYKTVLLQLSKIVWIYFFVLFISNMILKVINNNRCTNYTCLHCTLGHGTDNAL